MPSTHETILLCLFLLYFIQQFDFSAGYAYLSILRISCIWAILSLNPWLFSREVGFPKQVWTCCALNGWVEMATIFHWGRCFVLFLNCHCCPSFRLYLTIRVVLFWTRAVGRWEAPKFWADQCGARRCLSSLRCRSALAFPIPQHIKLPAAPSNWACWLLKPLSKLWKVWQLIHGLSFLKLYVWLWRRALIP